MKRSTLATITTTIGALALAAQLGCAKEKSDDSGKAAPAETKADTPAATKTETMATKADVATAKLLVMKFHHDT